MIDRRSPYHPTILVECKYWNHKVPQEVVHAFHSVMTNYGANTGFIVSKNGFQKGCYEAIKKTNIHLVTRQELEEQYYPRWHLSMIDRSLSNREALNHYLDPYDEKTPGDGTPLSDEMEQLLEAAYQPFHWLDARMLMLEGEFPLNEYPVTLPVLNDRFKVTGEIQLKNDRDYFDFMENNKVKALRHYRIAFGEIKP